MYGILKRDIDNILSAINEFPDIDKAILFGSRALGNYKKGSDIDIAISGKNIKKDTATKLYSILNEEKPIPFFFDIISIDNISNSDLKKHIEKFGKIIFIKEKNQLSQSQ